MNIIILFKLDAHENSLSPSKVFIKHKQVQPKSALTNPNYPLHFFFFFQENNSSSCQPHVVYSLCLVCSTNIAYNLLKLPGQKNKNNNQMGLDYMTMTTMIWCNY